MAGERLGEWYAGRSVLVTGATGFMGKVLVEKLLRTCPDIGTIYLLCRPKHGRTPVSRLADMIIKPAVFDKLKKENPSILNKLEPVEGDLSLETIIAKEKDRDRVLNEVSVVFHMAATLRLEAPLRPAVETNTLGTWRLLQFSKQMRNLKVLVHLSTAFCHGDQEVLEERVYPPPRDPHEIIKLVSTVDDETLQAMTPGILGVHPNSYTFSKCLAEALVDECSDELPAVIVRPSIVTPALYEPVPGWVDTLNGPVGLLVGGGKGVIRSLLCNPSNRAETIPVDIAINLIISIAARNHILKRSKSEGVACYNLSVGELVPVTWGEVLEKGRRQFFKYPFEAGLWYPGGTIRTNPFTHALVVFLFQTVPAYLIDFLLLIFRQKTFLVRLQRRIKLGMDVLQYFTMKQWNFKVQRGVYDQAKMMHPEDLKTFYIDNVDKDVDQYLLKVILGARQYCVKEPLASLTKARIQLSLLFLLHMTFKFSILLLFYLLTSNILESINPHYKLPIPSYKWADYLLMKT